ncbi:MAG TPA: glycosyl hydrolase 115 family protein, partial [Longimicrobium sp.]|nr:glycosyl hydrolase 115 family protein [Longimicrobium sp.]
VTLLFADDNWGNIRRLPGAAERGRAGGSGVYYHFDYVGGPRNYKWINTTQVSRVWEQMHLAWRSGADRIWIVNVGDIKPMELPISFFLDYAWNPAAIPAERIPQWTREWAAGQFGDQHADAIARILRDYTRFNSRRKPELLDTATYSLAAYGEAERVVAEYAALAEEAERIETLLPADARDAYFQLVLHPVLASANLHDLYAAAARNRLYARQGRASTSALADTVRALFDRDAALSRRYNHQIADGKWVHMMDQTHIGYTYWQEPPRNAMPRVDVVHVPDAAEMGVAVEGSDAWWPAARDSAVLPPMDAFNRQARWIDVFNRGAAPFDFTVDAGAEWLRVSPARGSVDEETRISLSVDWDRAPAGIHRVPVTVSGPGGRRMIVYAVVHNPQAPRREQVRGFVEADGYVAMEAEHFARAVDANGVRWQRIPEIGRTLGGMTPMPVTAPSLTPGPGAPHLEYRMHLFTAGEVEVRAYFSPSLDTRGGDGLRYAVSVDGAAPQIVNAHADGSTHAGDRNAAWERMVAQNVNVSVSRHRVDAPGEHVLRFWMVDPGLVLQRIVVDTGGLRPSYLGPPESFRGGSR